MDLVTGSLLIAFLSALAQGMTGFGFALVLVPLLSLIYDPKLAVLVSLTLGLTTKIPLLIIDWKYVQWRTIAPLVAACLVGNVAGTQVLLYADQSTLRLFIGITVVLLSVPLLLNYRLQVKREGLATLGVGLVSGVLTGSTSMGGPPVVLFGVNQRWAKESLRANMVGYFTITVLFTSAVLFFSGAIPREVFELDLWMLPGVVLGLLAGNAAFRRAPHELMHRVVVLFVIATGILGVYTSLAVAVAGKV